MNKQKRQAWNKGKLTYSADEITVLSNQYFADCAERNRRPTFAGLAGFMGVSSTTLYRWLDDENCKNPEACNALKMACDVMSDQLQQGKTAMEIFLLKQKSYGGFVDRQEVQQGGALNITITGGAGNWGK